MTQSKLRIQRHVSLICSFFSSCFFFLQEVPIEDKFKSFFLRRGRSVAIPSLLFPPADRLVHSPLHPHTALSVGERREFFPVLRSPEMETFHKLVLTMLVRNLLNYFVILSGKSVPKLRRYSQSQFSTQRAHTLVCQAALQWGGKEAYEGGLNDDFAMTLRVTFSAITDFKRTFRFKRNTLGVLSQCSAVSAAGTFTQARLTALAGHRSRASPGPGTASFTSRGALVQCLTALQVSELFTMG